MNCLSLMIPDLSGVFTAYALLEPMLMHYCGELREENIYCVPWYRATAEADKAAWLVKDPKTRFMDMRQKVAHACKYAALNFGPLHRFGTLEFRHAPTWDNIAPTMTWINMLLKIMDYGTKKSAQEVLEAWHNDPALWYRTVLGSLCLPMLHYHVLRAEEVGAVSVAEKFLPVSKTRVQDWAAPTLYVQGDGTERYAESRPPEIQRQGTRLERTARRVTLMREDTGGTAEPQQRYTFTDYITATASNRWTVDMPAAAAPVHPNINIETVEPVTVATETPEARQERRDRIDRMLREMSDNANRNRR